MTYLPPANGGRINATISGNTSGAGALISSGTMALAGGNNITLSQNGNTITISGGAGGGGVDVIGMSNIGNASGTTGVVSGSAVQYLLAGGNNVTLSQSLNGLSGTLSISAANQTVQTQNLFNLSLSGNTAGVMAQVSSGTLNLAGGNNITLSQNGNSVTISGGAVASNSFGMSNIGNTVGTTGMVSGSAMRFAFAGGNNVTLSQSINASSGTITISAANQTVQTQNLHNITLSGNTAGVMAQVSSGTLTLAGGNNITLSQNGNAITISAANGGAGGGIALANSQATFTSGTVNLIEGGGAITIASTTGQSFQVSVPQTSSLSATGAVSISTNGGTISIGAPAAATLSRFEYPEGLFTSLGVIGQGSLSLNHMYVPFNVTGSAMKIGGSLSAASNTSATTASANLSLWMGIYTLNGSTLSLASSGSANNGFQWSQSASTTANTSINGMRQMTVPMNVNMTPGEYWVAAVISSAGTYTSAGYTMYGNAQIAGAAGNAALSPIGVASTRDAMLFQGIYTAATAAGPTSIGSAAINITSASNVQRANFYNVIYNATY